jgi:chaperone required for assembly of F1-ATPase
VTDLTAKPVARRAYQTVSVERSDDGYAVRLDDKPLKTPGGKPVVVPWEGLAEAIAAEWRSQGAKPAISTLPMTRIAATALDRIPSRRGGVLDELLAYAETELVCHRAEAPPELVTRQQATWQPLLDWLAQQYDAPLAVTCGVLPKPQAKSSLKALRRMLEGLDDFSLAGLSVAVASAGSLVIGLAVLDGRLDAAQAFDAAELDATYQIEQWGEDSIAAQRRAELRTELETAERYLRLRPAPVS